MIEEFNLGDFNRRDFFKLLGGSSLIALFPWLHSCTTEASNATVGEKINIGVIGTGSRGMYHLNNIRNIPIPQAEVVALCDDYAPHLQQAIDLFPQAKQYNDYRKLLDDKNVKAVIITTPLNEHEQMTIEAFAAGKHVFCEKSMAISLDGCRNIYDAYKQSGKVLYIGQQRMFDPKYIRAMEMIHSGLIGTITGMRAYWYRNNDWRRPVPSPEFEKRINWRLYRNSSAGLVTELAAHQLQVGDWAIGLRPESVMGCGDIVYWKDGQIGRAHV